MTQRVSTRRRFLAAGAGTVGVLAFGPAFWRSAFGRGGEVVPGPSPYGPLRAADANGLRLPKGFTSRIVARAGRPVPGTSYPWHIFPDGGATFGLPGGGWVLTSNSESLAASGAGTSAIRFAADGGIDGAYRILAGTNANCAGGPTPWGTWLSCEEYDGGHVWECDPTRAGQGTIRPALGTFNHEAACVDPGGQHVYMTEDKPDGGLYRFTPTRYPDLSDGLLEVAVAGAGGKIGFKPVPDPSAITRATRAQVAGMKDFDGGEGIWFDSGHLYFSTKGDNRVWDLEVAAGALTVLYDGDAPLKGVDNLTVTRAGELYVCEDGGDMEVCLISTERTVAPFLRLVGAGAKGPAGGGNELAGVAFSPAGDRMYFSAQRAFDVGATYEVRGPFGGAGSPPPAAPVRRPAAAPAGLTVRAPARVTLAQLRRGVAIEVRSAQPGRAVVALRSPQLGRVPGQRGSTFRPTNVTVARSERRVAAGRTKVRLKATPRALARLRRRRSTAARLTVQVRAADGRVQVVTRQIRIVARRRERQT
jgi:uncharacterized protein